MFSGDFFGYTAIRTVQYWLYHCRINILFLYQDKNIYRRPGDKFMLDTYWFLARKCFNNDTLDLLKMAVIIEYKKLLNTRHSRVELRPRCIVLIPESVLRTIDSGP